MAASLKRRGDPRREDVILFDFFSWCEERGLIESDPKTGRWLLPELSETEAREQIEAFVGKFQ